MSRERIRRLPATSVAVALFAALAAAACAAGPGGSPAGTAPAPEAAKGSSSYVVYVANESSDLVSRVRFTPGAGAEVEEDVKVGIMPADLDSPHGLTISPDGRYWYVSLAHGTPFGRVWKYDTRTNRVEGRVELGMFPATMAITPDGNFLFVVNFNLHGDPVPSTVSVVYTPTMTEIGRTPTCVMPHGSRIDASGAKHYSACMHSEQVVEIDTRTFEVTARFGVAPGAERPLALDDLGEPDAHAGHAGHAAAAAVCSPTWAQPGRGEWARYVYVPCNRNGEILEIDRRDWRVARRFETGRGPYNLEPTPDGRLLIATMKADQAVEIFDLAEGRRVARIATTQPITHGAVVSPDGRFAFITNEAIGSTPGTVDVIDLSRLERVASVEVRFQPGGIDLLRAEP